MFTPVKFSEYLTPPEHEPSISFHPNWQGSVKFNAKIKGPRLAWSDVEAKTAPKGEYESPSNWYTS